MTEIKVEIYTYHNLCASCRLKKRAGAGYGYNCCAFGKALTEKDGDYLRCPECIAAEAELARLREIEKEHKEWIEGCNCNTCPLNAYEACDEICETKMSLINKIAQLAAELEEKQQGGGAL